MSSDSDNELERKLYELSTRFDNEYIVKDGKVQIFGLTTPEQDKLIREYELLDKQGE